MKIVEQTPTKIILKEQSWWIIIIILLSIILFTRVILSTILATDFLANIPINTPNSNFANPLAANFDKILVSLSLMITLIIGGLLSEFVTCEIDKDEQILSLNRLSLIGRKKAKYSLKEIADIILEIAPNQNQSSARISLFLNSGEMVPLTNFYTPGLESKQNIIEEVRRFLNSSIEIEAQTIDKLP